MQRGQSNAVPGRFMADPDWHECWLSRLALNCVHHGELPSPLHQGCPDARECNQDTSLWPETSGGSTPLVATPIATQRSRSDPRKGRSRVAAATRKNEPCRHQSHSLLGIPFATDPREAQGRILLVLL